jgi:hypothetical protein
MRHSSAAKYGLTKRNGTTQTRAHSISVLERILQYRLIDGSKYELNVGRIRCLCETGEIAQ